MKTLETAKVGRRPTLHIVNRSRSKTALIFDIAQGRRVQGDCQALSAKHRLELGKLSSSNASLPIHLLQEVLELVDKHILSMLLSTCS